MEAAGKDCGNEEMNVHISSHMRQLIHFFIPDSFHPFLVKLALLDVKTEGEQRICYT